MPGLALAIATTVGGIVWVGPSHDDGDECGDRGFGEVLRVGVSGGCDSCDSGYDYPNV